ncbi:MAG TPA: phosphotransferase [Candidatus Baltobacteraceae bacterium]|nr:phosphotransferase [Candidatus Baltobacteraceae bacterium]
MSEPWAADVEVTVELARALIGEQFPELAPASIEPLGEGWDNAAFLVGGAYVFRFPRRSVAAPLMAREIAILPLLAPHLPLAISAPRFAGTASGAYTWPFAGYPSFRGSPLSAVELDSRAYVRVATALGAFLRALHGLDATAAVAAGLIGDDIGRLDHVERMSKLDGRFASLSAAGLLADPAPLVEFLNAVAPRAPRTDRLTVVHGDLYAKHVMVDAGRMVEGIIDWGDVHYGDPAIDVSIVFEVLPPEARDAFADSYGEIDEETWRLARYRAIYHAALVAHYGHRIGNEELLRAGLTGLHYAAL